MKKILIILASVLFIFSSKAYCEENPTLFVKDPGHIYTIKFNRDVDAHGIFKGAITFTDERNLLLPFKLIQGNRDEVRLYPEFELEPGKIYNLTVHKGEVLNNLFMKNDYVKKIALNENTALVLAQKLYDNSLEGEYPGNYGYGSKSEFHRELLALTSRAPYLKTEFEKIIWTEDLGDAIDAFTRSAVLRDTGEVVAEPLSQKASAISFTYQFLSLSREYIEKNLAGFELGIDYQGIEKRLFIPKNLYDNPEPEGVPDTAGEELQYIYKDIDASELLRGLNQGDYIIKIKPIFNNVNSDLIGYSKNSYAQVINQGESKGDWEIKFLNWVNFLEIPTVSGTVRYDVSFESPYNSMEISLTGRDLKAENSGEGYLLSPLKRAYKLYWDIQRHPEILNFLKLNKNSLNCSIRYYNESGEKISEIQKQPIKFITDELPEITSIYNLTASQEKDILNPNIEYEIVVIKRGDIVVMDSKYPSKLHIFKVALSNNETFNWEMILKEHVGNIRYKNYGDGSYEDFKNKLLQTEGRLLITEIPQSNITDGINQIHLDTSKLQAGQYFMVIEDYNGLYYPIENMVVNLIEEEKIDRINNLRLEGDSVKFIYNLGTERPHLTNVYVLTESQYLEFLNNKDETTLKYWRDNERLLSDYSGYPKDKEEVILKLKAVPSNETLHIVLFEDGNYQAQEIYIP